MRSRRSTKKNKKKQLVLKYLEAFAFPFVPPPPPPPPNTFCNPQYLLRFAPPSYRAPCHYRVNHYVKIWHVCLGVANNTHPLSWRGGGEGAQTGKIQYLIKLCLLNCSKTGYFVSSLSCHTTKAYNQSLQSKAELQNPEKKLPKLLLARRYPGNSFDSFIHLKPQKPPNIETLIFFKEKPFCLLLRVL